MSDGGDVATSASLSAVSFARAPLSNARAVACVPASRPAAFASLDKKPASVRIVAQQRLRHKSGKAPFRSAFWGSVLLNVLAFIAPLLALLHP